MLIFLGGKMKRKLLLLAFIVLSIICAVCFVGCNANASVDKDDNPNADPFTQTDTTPSNGITYIAKSDGTYMVTNFSATSTDKHIVIASEHNGVPVTAIGNNAFENKNIESVVIPASITYIDSFAFFNCRKLRTVTFAENSKLQTIEHSAFLQCFALDNVVIPQGTIAIKDRAFRLCNSLKNISIPDSIKDMGIKVFDKCISLELITYENASYIGNQANPYLVLIDAAKNDLSWMTEPVWRGHTVADYIDLSRTFPDCVELREMFWGADPAQMSEEAREAHLRDVLISSFDRTMRGLLEEGALISPETALARNELVEEAFCQKDKSKESRKEI